LAVKDSLRRVGVLRTRKLAWPVISVGSLSAGGAGKTPVVIALAELLKQGGWAVDVLSRGYGREGNNVERVDSEAANAAARFGDEPVLISRRTGVPVWVGADRFASGLAAEAGSGQQTRAVHLLDDGFQHRQLERVLDIVLVTEADLHDALLPAGNRREPLSALRRADVVVFREEQRECVERQIHGLLQPDARIWTVRRTVGLPKSANAQHPNPGMVSFCAIARPSDFVDTLRTDGARVIDSIAFPDHHRYTAADIDRITGQLHASAGDAFITTEKDAVKITPKLRALLEATAPLLVVRLHAEFADPGGVLLELLERLK